MGKSNSYRQKYPKSNINKVKIDNTSTIQL